MSRVYLWCRAWPWFLPGFPFEKFDLLEEPQLGRALHDLARGWHEDHPGELLTHLTAKARIHRARVLGTPTGPFGSARRQIPRDRDPRTIAPTFKNISPLAGWTIAPHGIVFGNVDRDGPRPTRTILFHLITDPHRAEAILAVLRARMPLVQPSRVLGGIHSVLRYGQTSPSALDTTGRMLLARDYEGFIENQRPEDSWAAPIAEEARRIEGALVAEESEPEPSLTVLPLSERAALLALEAAQRSNPSQGIALKHMPAKIQEHGGRRLSPGRIPKLIESLRQRGFKIPDARGGAGYRLEESLSTQCAELRIACPRV